MNISGRPLVSVCIPSYNGEGYIGRAVESVLGQTQDDFELIVLDDQSTDRTVDVIKRFSDPRIRLIVNASRLGQMGNWNKALREASGNFIKLLPQDDLLYPACLEKQTGAFSKPGNEGIALVCCERDIIDHSGRIILKRSFRKRRDRLNGLTAVKACIRAGTNLIGEPAAVLFRSEAAARVGFFDDRNFYVIDLDYWCRILLEDDLFILPEPLCAFRVGRQSASFRVASSQDKDFRGFIRFLARDDRFRLTGMDCLRGKIMAFANRRLRQLFYKIAVKEA